ncbi:hypothetical protein JYB64_19435 [Algoriphagus aestuarii]|nr:hypothetical protein [Algoriphagus aestuarii]
MVFSKINRKGNKKLGYGSEVPPLLLHVKIIVDQQGLQEKIANEFFNHYQAQGWKTKTGVPIKNWKQILDQWIWERR